MRIPGLFVCECGNSTPIADLVIGSTGRSDAVYVFPGDVVCGCGKTMNTWYEEGETDGRVSSLPSRDHVDRFGGRDDADPVGRAGEPGQRPGPLPGDQVDEPADRGAGERELATDSAGGSPGHLSPAPSHLRNGLSIGGTYLIRGGEFVDHEGVLDNVMQSEFGHPYATLKVTVSPGVDTYTTVPLAQVEIPA